MDREAILAAVEAAGVVGAGGAGFPTHKKLAADCEALIINGAECEPLLQVDKELLHHYLPVVLEAAALPGKPWVQSGVLDCQGKYHALLGEIEQCLASWPGGTCPSARHLPHR